MEKDNGAISLFIWEPIKWNSSTSIRDYSSKWVFEINEIGQSSIFCKSLKAEDRNE